MDNYKLKFENGRNCTIQADNVISFQDKINDAENRFGSECVAINDKPIKKHSLGGFLVGATIGAIVGNSVPAHSVSKTTKGVKRTAKKVTRTVKKQVKKFEGGGLITFDDGYQFKEVSEDYARNNWQDEEIFALNLDDQSERVIEDESDIDSFELFGTEIGYKDKFSKGAIVPSCESDLRKFYQNIFDKMQTYYLSDYLLNEIGEQVPEEMSKADFNTLKKTYNKLLLQCSENGIDAHEISQQEAIKWMDENNLDRFEGGGVITFDDGYQFKEVSEDYARNNWQDDFIYGINLDEQTEHLVEDESDLVWDLYGTELPEKMSKGKKLPVGQKPRWWDKQMREYEFFVFNTETNKVWAGNEYLGDAKDELKEFKLDNPDLPLKVLSKRAITNKKINPLAYENWARSTELMATIRGERFEGGGKAGQKYKVFNYSDNLFATDETFKTKALANAFIKEFRKRYIKQGYYKDNNMRKIKPEDIDLLAIPSDFNPFKKFKDGGSTDDKQTYVVDVHSEIGEDSYTVEATSGRNAFDEAKHLYKKENPTYQGEISCSMRDKYENGGGVDTENKEEWQIKNSDNKYYSIGMDGKIKWFESPDLGYTYTKLSAEKYKNHLESSLGFKDLQVVKYNKDWWKYEAGGMSSMGMPPQLAIANEISNKLPATTSAIDKRIAEKVYSDKPSAWEDRGLQKMADGGGVGSFFYDSRKDKAFQVIFIDGDKMGIQYLDRSKNPIGDTTTIDTSEFEYNVKMGAWGKWKQAYATGGMVGNEIVFDRWGEYTTGTITESMSNGNFAVSSGMGSYLVEPNQVISITPRSEKSKKGWFFAQGGSTNSGLSWQQDHAKHNKSESYERPISERKKFAGGGDIKSTTGLKKLDAKRFGQAVDYIYYDDKTQKFYFIDFENRVMEIKNKYFLSDIKKFYSDLN